MCKYKLLISRESTSFYCSLMISKLVFHLFVRPVSTAKTIAMAGQDPSLQLDRKGEGTADHSAPNLGGSTRRSVKSRPSVNNSGKTNTPTVDLISEFWRMLTSRKMLYIYNCIKNAQYFMMIF